MSNKIVRYNGETLSYYPCSDPKALIKGAKYRVTNERDLGWQTNYTLEGVDGQFNSVWFDEMNIYIAVAKYVPTVGSRFNCSVIEKKSDGRIFLNEAITSTVQNVVQLNGNTFMVETMNSFYMVQI